MKISKLYYFICFLVDSYPLDVNLLMILNLNCY